jgi:hypothetical protein
MMEAFEEWDPWSEIGSLNSRERERGWRAALEWVLENKQLSVDNARIIQKELEN